MLAVAGVAVANQVAPVPSADADRVPVESLVEPTPARATPSPTPRTESAPSPVPIPAPPVEDISPLDKSDPDHRPVAPPAAGQAAPAPVPSPQVSAAPTPAPTLAPTDERPVTISWILSQTSAVPPAITGTGTPGGLVAIVDDTGAVVASTLVDATGGYSARVDPDELRQQMTIIARHTSPSGALTESAPLGPLSFPVPTVEGDHAHLTRSDADGDGAADDLTLALAGDAGASVWISIDGEAAQIVPLDDVPTAEIVDCRPGLHVVIMRYVDPVTGDLGVAEDTVIVVAP